MISKQILNFLLNLKKPKLATDGVVTMNPYENKVTQKLVNKFYTKYYSDNKKRLAFIGINPGRLGSGLTGIGFTDPINLEEKCEIENNFDKKHELSSRFVYDVIEAFGETEQFYNQVYVTSVVPLGFIQNGVNLNYYDIKQLETELKPYIKKQIEKQLSFLRTDVAFCIGKGKNRKFLEKLNQEMGYFDKLEVLPHPRWVMQYRLKRKEKFVEEFVKTIGSYCNFY